MESFLRSGPEQGRRLQAKDMKNDTLDRDQLDPLPSAKVNVSGRP